VANARFGSCIAIFKAEKRTQSYSYFPSHLGHTGAFIVEIHVDGSYCTDCTLHLNYHNKPNDIRLCGSIAHSIYCLQSTGRAKPIYLQIDQYIARVVYCSMLQR
jgi:hypothetical protein